MVISKIANLSKMKRCLAYFSFLFIILLLLFGAIFLISHFKYKQKEAIRDNTPSVNLSNISVNGQIYSDPLNPIRERERKEKPLVFLYREQKIETKQDLLNVFGENYIEANLGWVFQDQENKIKLYIKFEDFEDDNILVVAVSELSGDIYPDKNILLKESFSVFTVGPDYIFVLRTWPSQAISKIRNMQYFYWKDYILIPLVISLTLLPLLFALVYKKIWIIILNVVFYVLYYIAMMLTVILYT